MGQADKYNPLAKLGKVLAGTTSPSPSPTPSPSPSPAPKVTKGDIELPPMKKAAVDASGRRVDREPEAKKKSPAISRSMSKR